MLSGRALRHCCDDPDRRIFPFMKNVLRVDSLLAIRALGVVFGDIGTSPLYAMHALFSHAVIPRSAEAITGIISLVLWAL